MTKLTKPVQRSVDGLLRNPITVILEPGGTIGFREYRARHIYRLPVMTAYKWAVEAEREANRRAKQKAKRSRP